MALSQVCESFGAYGCETERLGLCLKTEKLDLSLQKAAGRGKQMKAPKLTAFEILIIILITQGLLYFLAEICVVKAQSTLQKSIGPERLRVNTARAKRRQLPQLNSRGESWVSGVVTARQR